MTETVDRVSYKSPYYDDLDAAVTQRLGLPPGLLPAIRTRGERSNADQVSSADAKTVYQIIPATRDAALKKWGVDAYLNEENAAYVAGRVLKESLERNQGVAPLAVAEYIGGTDPKQWGPTTRAYVQRVTGEKLMGGENPRQSTYDRLVQKQEAANTPSLARVYDAYKSGKMTPEDAAAFEADVAAGKVILPRGMKVKETAKEPTEINGIPVAPPGVIDAYQSAKMTAAERHEFETDVKEGRVKVPPGVKVAEPAGIVSRASDAINEAVSGAARETEQTKTLPDWLGMPELNSLTAASAKTALGTLFAGPAEAVKVIQAQYPDTKVTQDAKGNYLLTSSVDGKQYAIKPGFQWGDVPRAIGAIAAFTPAGRASTIAGGAAASAATEAAIQTTQAATGGTFDTKDVAIAGIGGAAVPAVVMAAQAAKPAVVAGVQAIERRLPGAAMAGNTGAIDDAARAAAAAMPDTPPASIAAPATPGVPSAAPAATAGGGSAPKPFTPSAEWQAVPEGTVLPPGLEIRANLQTGLAEARVPPAAAAKPAPSAPPPAAAVPDPAVPPTAPTMTATELAATTRKAAGGGFGSKGATAKLAAETAPDPATVKAMDDLGFHYQPDHVTTNQAYRELAQAVKSVPGSETRAAELQILQHNAQKADELITTLGGTRDLSTLNAGLRTKLGQIHADLKKQAKELFEAVEKKIDPVTPTPATDTLAFIRENARKLGGEANLSAGEKDLLKKFGAEGNPPTYALVDSERKAANAAKYNNNSPFATMDSRLRDGLITAMRADQERVAVAAGLGDMWNAANSATKAYKAVQDDLVTLFGKTLEGSIVGDLNRAVTTLSKGDISHFVKVISAIPEALRREVVASGLSSAFGVNARNGSINFRSYANWFEGLERNKVARDALFTNLPPEAVKALTNLYKASKGISMATRERITTGRIQAVSEELLKGDSLMGRVFDVAKRSGAAEAVTSSVGLPGAGVAAALASAFTKGRTSTMKAADALINSPEFIAAARNATRANINKLARSNKFAAFVKAAGNPQELRDREKWVAQALQANKDAKK